MITHLLRLTLACLCTSILFAAAPEDAKGNEPKGNEPKGKGGKGGKTAEAPKGSVDLVAAAKPTNNPTPTFTLTSPVVKDGAALPTEFTGDGASASLPLAWANVPKGTVSLALVMHHLDPEGKTKIYWLMYDIDPKTTSVAKNATDFGKMGLSTVHNRAEYAPPHSKGPGLKKYVLTIFALSAKPDLTNAPTPLTVESLLPALKGKILGAADLNVTYTRPAGASAEEEKRPARKGPPAAAKGE